MNVIAQLRKRLTGRAKSLSPGRKTEIWESSLTHMRWTRPWRGKYTNYPHWTTFYPNSRWHLSSPPSIWNQATGLWVSMNPAVFSRHPRPRMEATGGWECPLDAMSLQKSSRRSYSKPSKAWKAYTVLQTTSCCMVLVARTMMKLSRIMTRSYRLFYSDVVTLESGWTSRRSN